jgi:hypothetical protein
MLIDRYAVPVHTQHMQNAFETVINRWLRYCWLRYHHDERGEGRRGESLSAERQTLPDRTRVQYRLGDSGSSAPRGHGVGLLVPHLRQLVLEMSSRGGVTVTVFVAVTVRVGEGL